MFAPSVRLSGSLLLAVRNERHGHTCCLSDGGFSSGKSPPRQSGRWTKLLDAIEAFRAIGALDKLGLVLPFLIGGGMRLTPALSADAALSFESKRALPGGSVEIVYAVDHQTD